MTTAVTKSNVLFADEVDMTKFSILEKVRRGNDSWSAKLIYDGSPLHIQTPPLRVTFDLKGYKYDPNDDKQKYSINVTLDPNIDGVQTLVNLINTIDNTVINTFRDDFKNKEVTFISSVKTSKNTKYYPSLRCKMVSNKNRFKCEIKLNGESVATKIKDIVNVLIKGSLITLVLQLNPVWHTENKYGVSWQAIVIDQVKPKIEMRKPYE